MSWAAIIAAIWAVIGPVVSEWLKQWLESLLNKAAAVLPPADGMTRVAAHERLLTKAIELTPRLAFGRRALLKWIRRKGDGSPLTADDMDELHDLACAAAEE